MNKSSTRLSGWGTSLELVCLRHQASARCIRWIAGLEGIIMSPHFGEHFVGAKILPVNTSPVKPSTDSGIQVPPPFRSDGQESGFIYNIIKLRARFHPARACSTAGLRVDFPAIRLPCRRWWRPGAATDSPLHYLFSVQQCLEVRAQSWPSVVLRPFVPSNAHPLGPPFIHALSPGWLFGRYIVTCVPIWERPALSQRRNQVRMAMLPARSRPRPRPPRALHNLFASFPSRFPFTSLLLISKFPSHLPIHDKVLSSLSSSSSSSFYFTFFLQTAYGRACFAAVLC